MITAADLERFLNIVTNAWITSHAYLVNNKVKHTGSIYKCLVAHTSGTFTTDLAAGKWELDNNELIEDCINEAIGIAETETNQKLIYDEYTINITGNGNNYVYLPAKYIYEITAIKVYNKLGAYAWDDIFESGYGLYDGTGITGIVLEESTGLVSSEYKLTLKQGYVFTFGAGIKITFKGGYVSADNWITATSYLVDDYVRYNNKTYVCLIAHTSDDFATDLTALKWELATEITAPKDLQNAVKYQAAFQYAESPAGMGWFAKTSNNVGGQSSEGFSIGVNEMRDYINKIFSKHRLMNI